VAESVARQRINWRVLGVEAAAIFLSVLLGFGVAEWREARNTAQQRLDTLTAFSRETERNRDEVLKKGSYHTYVSERINAGIQDGSLRYVSEIFQIEGVTSFSPIDLSNTAWKTAIATGAIGHLDFDTASSLSDLYDDLDVLEAEQQRIREIALATMAAPTPEPIGPFGILLDEFVGIEANLLHSLDEARMALAVALDQPPVAPSP